MPFVGYKADQGRVFKLDSCVEVMSRKMFWMLVHVALIGLYCKMFQSLCLSEFATCSFISKCAKVFSSSTRQTTFHVFVSLN